jgi:cytochrome c
MDELRVNKLFAGFLFAALLLMAGIKIADFMVPREELAQNSYVIEVVETTAMAAAAPVNTGPEPILAMLANADLGAGEKLSKKCSACHVFDAGGKNKVGPALWNIVNRPMAAADGYAYSDALVGFGGDWDYQSLNAFLAKPKAYISGTKMNFGGLKKSKDRANLIAWMRAKADSPAALPSADDIEAEGAN